MFGKKEDEFVLKMHAAIEKIAEGTPERLSLEIQLKTYEEQKEAARKAKFQRNIIFSRMGTGI